MALEHNSKAWARAYSKKAQVTLPPLEEYERKIVPLNAATITRLALDEKTAQVVGA